MTLVPFPGLPRCGKKRQLPQNRIAAISGPNFAVEIARKLPAATVVACPDLSIRETVQSAFITPYLRVYTHWDIIGVELGGALKNIIALACGMIEGTGLGYNAQAALISRGIAEISRLGVGLGADPLTFAGLSGLGDLVLTCTGHLSRNRQAGIAVGKGEDIETFMARTGYTVEGYTTVKSAMNISETVGVSMPITCVVYKILYQKLSVMRGLSEIMSRESAPNTNPIPVWSAEGLLPNFATPYSTSSISPVFLIVHYEKCFVSLFDLNGQVGCTWHINNSDNQVRR